MTIQNPIIFINAKLAADDIAKAGLLAYYAADPSTRIRRAEEIDRSFRELAIMLGYEVERSGSPDQEERERFAAMEPEEREYELAESRADDAYQASRERAA